MKLKRLAIGLRHIDIAKVQAAEGERNMSVGIDRTNKFAVAHFVGRADRKTAWEFLHHRLRAVLYHTPPPGHWNAIGPTDNGEGSQFAEQPRNRITLFSRPMRFGVICNANGIDYRQVMPSHP